VVKIDPEYAPAPIERRNIFGITFEQGYNDLTIDEKMLEHIVTRNRDLPQGAKNDMLLSLITLKYTQSNSVCYVKDGQTLGVGAGQQSRIHCTRLAGNKADIWWLRRHPKVLDLPFPENVRRPDRDNAIDAFIADVLTQKEKVEWISQLSGVTLGSDAFFPFGDNVERAHQSGVQYIAQPGGSIRDDQVIETADKYGMVMAFTGTRLFHH
jgi:AICAR transformylase/IMP cyclohydrolase PurH